MKKVMLFLAPLLSLVTVLAVTLPAIGSSALAMGPRRPGPRESTSSNWSGYAVENYTLVTSGKHQRQREVITNDSVSSVTGTWVVPTVSSNGYSACWVGIDGYSDSTVEQIGTEQDYQGGIATYSAWYEMYPAYPVTLSNTVTPGDTMTATITWVSGNTFSFTLHDNPGDNANYQEWTYGPVNQTLPNGSTALRQSAEAIVEAPSAINGVLPLAGFASPIPFSRVEVNGAPLGTSGSTWSIVDPITMIDGTAEATPSQPPGNSDSGSTFNVTYSLSSPSPHGHGNGHGKN